MLRIRVNTASAEIIETEPITAGRVGLQCALTFDSAWDGLAKTVVVSGVVRRDRVLVGDEIEVPGECLVKENFLLRIGVVGKNGDGTVVIPTVWTNFGKILPSAEESGETPAEPTPDVVAQIQQNSANALLLAQRVMQKAEDGEFDGKPGAPGTPGNNGASAYELAVEHGYTGTEAEWLASLHGQDAVVDPTLTNAGEAADAKATGDELYRHRLELTALSPEIRADTYAWNLRKNYNGSGSYVTADGFGITSNYIPVQPGARVQNTAPEKDGNGKVTAMHINEFAGTTWLRRTILASGKYLTIGADATSIRIAYGYASNQGVTITQELIDATFSVRIIQQPASGSDGGGITVDDALSGSSTNPVQNKVIKAALDGKYTKPAGGIPASDLAEDVQASLNKADTALQSFTETDPTVPNWAKASSKPSYTASEVGAVAVAQGVAHAGEFCVVGSDGNVTTMALSTWSAGSY